MGEDWGVAERRALEAALPASAATVWEGQTNADPVVAELRQDVAVIKRQMGRRGTRCCRASRTCSARRRVLLPVPTWRREAWRRNGRTENQRLVTALLPRGGSKSGHLLTQQMVEECGDAFQPQQQKGKAMCRVGEAGAGVQHPPPPGSPGVVRVQMRSGCEIGVRSFFCRSFARQP